MLDDIDDVGVSRGIGLLGSRYDGCGAWGGSGDGDSGHLCGGEDGVEGDECGEDKVAALW